MKAEITEKEGFWVNVLRLNARLPRLEIRKRWQGKRWGCSFSWRSGKNLWGRFGGGWNWALGIQIGRTTVHLNLLICEVSIWRRKKSAI